MFHTLWLQLGDPEFEGEPEYKLLVPGRKFRADFAFPKQRIVVEVDGGVYGFTFTDKHGNQSWRRGGHSSITGQLRDIERGNQLAIHGWRRLHFTPKELDEDPAACIKVVLQALFYGQRHAGCFHCEFSMEQEFCGQSRCEDGTE